MAKTGRLIESSGSVTAYAPTPLTIDTALPSRILSWPAVTTSSPAESPSTISTRPSRRVPITTLVSWTLPVDDLEHELVVALRHDGLLWHAQGVLFELQAAR